MIPMHLNLLNPIEFILVALLHDSSDRLYIGLLFTIRRNSCPLLFEAVNNRASFLLSVYRLLLRLLAACESKYAKLKHVKLHGGDLSQAWGLRQKSLTMPVTERPISVVKEEQQVILEKLHKAVCDNNKQKVEETLPKLKARARKRWPWNLSPLHAAARLGHDKIVEVPFAKRNEHPFTCSIIFFRLYWWVALASIASTMSTIRTRRSMSPCPRTNSWWSWCSSSTVPKPRCQEQPPGSSGRRWKWRNPEETNW